MKEYIQNPKEAICLLIYNQKLNVGEISDNLYKYRNPKVSSWIGELENIGWVIEKQVEKGQKKDRREHYYQATSKCLLDTIKEDIKLLSQEEKTLENVLNSKGIREFIGNSVNKKYSDFSLVKHYLGMLCSHVIVLTNYTKDETGWNSKEFRRIWREEISEVMKKKIYSDSNSSEVESMLFDFFELNPSLLEKLSSLWVLSKEFQESTKQFIGIVKMVNKLSSDLRVSALKKKK